MYPYLETLVSVSVECCVHNWMHYPSETQIRPGWKWKFWVHSPFFLSWAEELPSHISFSAINLKSSFRLPGVPGSRKLYFFFTLQSVSFLSPWPDIIRQILSRVLSSIRLNLDQIRPILVHLDINEGFSTKHFGIWAKFFTAKLPANNDKCPVTWSLATLW